MDSTERCGRCGEDTRAGTRRFAGRVRQPDNGFLCRECAHVTPWDLERRDVEITNPNANFPNTH